ncbi:MAG TPA: hypothetical protein DC061_13115 [Gemmobacter sp.]|nr:MAG: hypothetical protein A2X69_00815 [Rhodobacteraceae bacterium GWF1_65_7]HBD91441.1 hypothetical protein [Gemmobacter sp.]
MAERRAEAGLHGSRPRWPQVTHHEKRPPRRAAFVFRRKIALDQAMILETTPATPSVSKIIRR